MADLEKNLSEAIEEVLDEAQQPDSKADKGIKNLLNKVHQTPRKSKAGKVKSSNLKKILLTKPLTQSKVHQMLRAYQTILNRKVLQKLSLNQN